MKTQPYGKKIIVEREAVKQQTEGGLFIPTQVQDKEKPRRGTVLATSDGSGIAIGDTVIFGRFSGIEIDDILILKLEDIYAVEKN